MWYEGENYPLFALRGLLPGAAWARAAGVALAAEPEPAARLRAALLAPALTALPDFTFPARKDSRLAVSLAQPMYLEVWEVGLAETGQGEGEGGKGELESWLKALYNVPAVKPEVFDSYLHDAPTEPLPSPISRDRLSWWALLFMEPELSSDAPPWSPDSVLLESQGLAVLRTGAEGGARGGPGGGTLTPGSAQPGAGHGNPDRLNPPPYPDGFPCLPDFDTGTVGGRRADRPVRLARRALRCRARWPLRGRAGGRQPTAHGALHFPRRATARSGPGAAGRRGPGAVLCDPRAGAERTARHRAGAGGRGGAAAWRARQGEGHRSGHDSRRGLPRAACDRVADRLRGDAGATRGSARCRAAVRTARGARSPQAGGGDSVSGGAASRARRQRRRVRYQRAVATRARGPVSSRRRAVLRARRFLRDRLCRLGRRGVLPRRRGDEAGPGVPRRRRGAAAARQRARRGSLGRAAAVLARSGKRRRRRLAGRARRAGPRRRAGPSRRWVAGRSRRRRGRLEAHAARLPRHVGGRLARLAPRACRGPGRFRPYH